MTTFNSCKVFILGAFFSVFHIVYAQDTAAHDLVLEQRLKTCAFEVIGTSHIKIGDRNLLEEQTFCSFPFVFEKVQQHFGLFPPAHGWLTITKIALDHDNGLDGSGFERNKKNKWIFRGYGYLIEPRKFKQLSTTEIQNLDGFTLIGRQTESGYSAQGGPLSMDAVHIIKEIPDYLIDVKITFEIYFPKKKVDELVAELIKIVQSVHVRD